MKNTLWTFGDSFTEDIRHRLEMMIPKWCPESYQIKDFLINKYGIENIHSHQKYLSDYYELDNKIYATSGNSNYHIFNYICDVSSEFKKDDIVIVQWTMLTRFGLPQIDNDGKRLVSMRLDNTHQNELSSDSLNKIFSYRDEMEYYRHEIMLYSKIIKHLQKLIGFKLYFWSLEPKILKYAEETNFIDKHWLFYPNILKYDSYLDYFKTHGVQNMTEEVNNKWHDVHFGVQGNKRQYELFKEYIDEDTRNWR
jgi:hypothetical protein